MNSLEGLIKFYKSGLFERIAWCDVRSSLQPGSLEIIKRTTKSATEVALAILSKPPTVNATEWDEISPKIAVKLSLSKWEIDGLKEEAEIYEQISKFILSNYYTPNVVLCLAVKECEFDMFTFFTPDIIQARLTQFLKESDPPRWKELADKKFQVLERRAKVNPQVNQKNLDAYLPEYKKVQQRYESIKQLTPQQHTLRLVVTQHIPGDSLANYLDRDTFSDEQLLLIVYQVLFTLKIFNRFGIRHGDFHSNNLLIQSLGSPAKIAYVEDTAPVAGSRYTVFETSYLAKIFDWDFGGIYDTIQPLKNVINQQALIEGLCEGQAACGRQDKADMTRFLLGAYGILASDKNTPVKLQRYPQFANLVESSFDKRIIAEFNTDFVGLLVPHQLKNPTDCPEDVKEDYVFAKAGTPWINPPDCWIKSIDQILAMSVFDKYRKTFNQSGIETPFVYGLWPDEQTRLRWIGDAKAAPDIEKTQVVEEETLVDIDPLIQTTLRLTQPFSAKPFVHRLSLNSVLFALFATITSSEEPQWRMVLENPFLATLKTKPFQTALTEAMQFGKDQLELDDKGMFVWLLFIASLPEFVKSNPALLYTPTVGLQIVSTGSTGQLAKQTKVTAPIQISSIETIYQETSQVPLSKIDFSDSTNLLIAIFCSMVESLEKQNDYSYSAKLFRVLDNTYHIDGVFEYNSIPSQLIIRKQKDHVEYLTQSLKAKPSLIPQDAFLTWNYVKFAELLDQIKYQ